MAELRATILGCGSSGGVPRIGGVWGDCDPNEPRNIRRRCSLLLERITDQGRTQVLIDTAPDMRAQLLDAGIARLDAVVFTHSHADHVHGIDDLRQIVFTTRKRLPVWADGPTQDALLSRFGYAFVQPKNSPYPPILDLNTISGAVTIEGAGGPMVLHPIRLNHGTVDALGFRVEGLAYAPDVVGIYPESWPMLEGLDIWIVDALRRKPHPSHAHLEMTLDWIARAQPRQAVLTNMHVDLDYATLCAELPDQIRPAHDGMILSLKV
ncbi:MBL fold metallo-hydrolase [Natronohydrobacter thiooxidans]|uniref:MBL fold metallo-hydrolase n=1 Tax=Natronohydrobacter thiooxidans TaxID=87172 RepID=UPI0008FF264B|nr:MBL fold metallo-hydrolase [Natronohydrobacter thiooxidans]